MYNITKNNKTIIIKEQFSKNFTDCLVKEIGSNFCNRKLFHYRY